MTSIWALMAINLLVFIAVIAFPKLVYLLALQTASFMDRPWSILTSMFTHADLWHIFANMLTLYFFGRFLILLLSTRTMLIIYFVGGIVGNLLYMLLASPVSYAIGASGAIFALGGALTVIMPKLKVIVFPIPIPIPLWVSTLIGFLILSFIPGIAWQAHLGGLLVGLLAGWLLRKKAHIPMFY
jgi:membrane associated rhomboid family serine protease